LKRLFFEETAGKVRYQHSRHGSQEESIEYLDFIARDTSHIPDKAKVMIRYYGLYSNVHRGKIRKAGADHSYPLIIEDGPIYVPSKGWPGIRLGLGDPKGLGGGSFGLSFVWWPDERHLFYRRAEDNRQDHPSSRADL
jgi:hypothetical protein